MNSILRLSAFALAMAVSVSSAYEIPKDEAETYVHDENMKTIELVANYGDKVLDPDFDHRELDTVFTLEPTKKPTKRPTRKPTVAPVGVGSFRPSPTSADVCGTIEKTDGSGLTLGPYDRPSYQRGTGHFDCNNDHIGDWWHRGMYHPEYKYNFRVSKRCEYLYRAPENDFSWEEVRDVNSWLEQMVILNTKQGHKSYRVTGEDVIFKGYDDFPNLLNVLEFRQIDDCPEKYCVGIFGDFLVHRGDEYGDAGNHTRVPRAADKEVSYQGNNGRPSTKFPLGRCEGDCDSNSECEDGLICFQRSRNQPLPPTCIGDTGKASHNDYCGPKYGLEIIWAFTDQKQHWDFYHQLRSMFNSKYKERIFGTNSFLRCGCESFCMENSNIQGVGGSGGDVIDAPGATCYVEEKCGTRVFMVNYPEDFTGTKASWADVGTTNVMDWFSECAQSMYGCTEFTKFDTDTFEIKPGGYWKHYHAFPKIYEHDTLDITDYDLPWLTRVGNDWKPAEAFPLGVCEGDCDSDSDCAEGLVCMQRRGDEPVPGCSHRGGIKGWDYCYDPNYGNANPLVVAKRVGNNLQPPEAFPLGECEGDCDRDSDCQEGLVCHQRNYNQPIPGCVGSKTSSNDYCVKVEYRDAFKTNGETGWVDVVIDPEDLVSVNWTYGLGGNNYYGFKDNLWYNDGAIVEWTCPSRELRSELRVFGEYVGNAELFRYARLDEEVPSIPCKEEEFLEPEYPPEVDPFLDCANVFPTPVYCHHDTRATCYAHKGDSDCGIIFTVHNATGVQEFDDVAEWHDACLANMDCHRVPEWANLDGNITKVGMPRPIPNFSKLIGWELLLGNKKYNGQSAIKGNRGMIWYNCANWIQTYKSANFTKGAGDYYDFYGNTYGDLYATKECTERPSSSPSLAPTVTSAPTESPSMSPTFCAESYLTSEDLNIALVVDLSFSTYETDFSAENPVGDVNGDGKGNTILDAQVVAIEELLLSIAKSEQLNNENCEIQLISFSTSARSHGTWKPLEKTNDTPNETLMNYVKEKLRAPTSNDEVQKTNNGYTNFDAALDEAVNYFNTSATADRKDLLVFLSDGKPNVRGDGDDEGYCADTVTFWKNDQQYKCSDLNIAPGVPHDFCKGDDPTCANTNEYQDCVRGPAACTNAAAVTAYDSEIAALTKLGVERLAIGVGEDSDVSKGSALWDIDNNPAKYKGVLPLQALNLDELSEYLGSLCILNTEPPTNSPSESPSASPTVSALPSASPSSAPTGTPSTSPSSSPSSSPTKSPTDNPTSSPSGSPTDKPSASPSNKPTTGKPSADLDRFGDDDEPRDDDEPPPGPGCPEDIELVHQWGETPFPLDSVRIVSQDTTSVTVQIHQTFTDERSSLDDLYYQHMINQFSSKCYEKKDLDHGMAVEFTIQCMISNNIGILHFWVADGGRKGFLNADDRAEIPDCCYPTIDSETAAVAEYALAIRCVTACPDVASSNSRKGSDTYTCTNDERCMQEEEHKLFLRGGGSS